MISSITVVQYGITVLIVCFLCRLGNASNFTLPFPPVIPSYSNVRRDSEQTQGRGKKEGRIK